MPSSAGAYNLLPISPSTSSPGSSSFVSQVKRTKPSVNRVFSLVVTFARSKPIVAISAILGSVIFTHWAWIVLSWVFGAITAPTGEIGPAVTVCNVSWWGEQSVESKF